MRTRYAEALRTSRAFAALIRGNVKRIGPREGSAQQLGLGQGMHLMATLRWMRVSHATCTVPKPPAPAFGKGLVSIEYQLRFSHAHIILQGAYAP